jgi:hypothetical protein
MSPFVTDRRPNPVNALELELRLDLPHNVPSVLIFSQPNKPRMPQVTIPRPFGELDLGDQLRLEPHTVFHFFLGQGPLRPLLLRQIGKRASVDL